MGQGPESRMHVEESPSRVPEWPLLSCLQCVVGRCHTIKSFHVVDSGVFAGLLPPGGELFRTAFSSDTQVPHKQFTMDNPSIFHPPDAQHGRLERGVSLM
jgi:hypothetical protein